MTAVETIGHFGIGRFRFYRSLLAMVKVCNSQIGVIHLVTRWHALEWYTLHAKSCEVCCKVYHSNVCHLVTVTDGPSVTHCITIEVIKFIFYNRFHSNLIKQGHNSLMSLKRYLKPIIWRSDLKRLSKDFTSNGQIFTELTICKSMKLVKLEETSYQSSTMTCSGANVTCDTVPMWSRAVQNYCTFLKYEIWNAWRF